MKTNVELVPLDFPRSWFPFDTPSRAMRWVVLVGLMTFGACYFMDVKRIENYLFLFGVAFLCATAVLRMMSPARMVVLNIPKATAIEAITELNIVSKFGYRYIRSSSGGVWKISRGNFLYPCSQDIEIESGGHELTVVGPHAVLVQISWFLEKKVARS